MVSGALVTLTPSSEAVCNVYQVRTVCCTAASLLLKRSGLVGRRPGTKDVHATLVPLVSPPRSEAANGLTIRDYGAAGREGRVGSVQSGRSRALRRS